nr:unnamed protein product [Callosobruchus analis]
MKLGEKLLGLKKYDDHIIEINIVGRNRIKIEVDSAAIANSLVEDSFFPDNNLIEYVPNHLTDKRGLVRGVDTSLDEESLLRQSLFIKTMNTGNLKIVQWNARSLQSNKHSLLQIFNEEHFDIAIVYETWYKRSHDVRFRNFTTRISPPGQQKSVVDITLMTTNLALSSHWAVMTDTYGSDHFPILITFNTIKTDDSLITPVSKWSMTNVKWDVYSAELESILLIRLFFKVLTIWHNFLLHPYLMQLTSPANYYAHFQPGLGLHSGGMRNAYKRLMREGIPSEVTETTLHAQTFLNIRGNKPSVNERFKQKQKTAGHNFAQV